MNKKLVYYIAIAFLVIVSINLLMGLFGVGYGVTKLFESNENSEIVNSELNYHNDISPKIDSLIQVNPRLAIQNIDKFIKEYPTIYFLELQKGMAYYQLDSFELAIREFEKSMTKSGYEYPRALGYIGWTLIETGKFEEGIERLIKAAEQNSDYVRDIALAYYEQEDWENAILYYEKRLDYMTSQKDPYFRNEIKEVNRILTDLKKKL